MSLVLDAVYQTLFHPVSQFKRIAIGPVSRDRLLLLSALVVLSVSAMGITYATGATSFGWLLMRGVMSAVGGIILWLITGSIIATAAYVFGLRGRPVTLLILTGLAMLPWIFLPVFGLFKLSGALVPPLSAVGILGALSLWIWSGFLFWMAVRYTYNLSLERLFLAIGLPLLMSFLLFLWVGQFFAKLIGILT